MTMRTLAVAEGVQILATEYSEGRSVLGGSLGPTVHQNQSKAHTVASVAGNR